MKAIDIVPELRALRHRLPLSNLSIQVMDDAIDILERLERDNAVLLAACKAYAKERGLDWPDHLSVMTDLDVQMKAVIAQAERSQQAQPEAKSG